MIVQNVVCGLPKPQRARVPGDSLEQRRETIALERDQRLGRQPTHAELFVIERLDQGGGREWAGNVKQRLSSLGAHARIPITQRLFEETDSAITLAHQAPAGLLAGHSVFACEGCDQRRQVVIAQLQSRGDRCEAVCHASSGETGAAGRERRFAYLIRAFRARTVRIQITANG